MTDIITPRTRTVYLLQGEDEERLSELRDKAVEARAKADKLKPRRGQPAALPLQMGELDPWTEADTEATAAEQAADDFRDEAEARGIKVVMRSIGRKRWKQITGQHPPRPDDEGDKVARYNIETAPDEIVPACLVSPALGDADREEFLDSLSHGQFDVLAWVAHSLNTGFGADPTQRLLSVSSQTSPETSSLLSEPA